MPPTKPQIHSLFATPLCVHFVPVAVEMNAEIKPLILARTKDSPTRGQGAYAKEDFRSWGNHHAETLLAVVTDIVSPREIRVEQANWMNKGEIDHSTPVLDVSAANDWSKVRVWDVPSKQFGSRVYAISGFILKGLTKQASAD